MSEKLGKIDGVEGWLFVMADWARHCANIDPSTVNVVYKRVDITSKWLPY
jgi:hypothetical protein